MIDALNTLTDPATGKPLVDRIIPREEAAHGPYADQGADLHLILDGYKTIAFPLFATEGRVLTPQIRGDSGCHRLHGIFIGQRRRPSQQALRLSNARIIDLAPTILHILNVPVPEDMDGRVLTRCAGAGTARAKRHKSARRPPPRRRRSISRKRNRPKWKNACAP